MECKHSIIAWCLPLWNISLAVLYHISWWRSVNDANDQKLQDRSSTCSHLVWTQIEAKTSQDYMNIKLCRTVSLPKTPATIYSSNSIDFLGIETLIHWRHKERSPKRRQNTPSDVQRSVMTVFTRHKNLFFSPHACMARHRHFVSMTTSRLCVFYVPATVFSWLSYIA
jgi:hypothetical protein